MTANQQHSLCAKPVTRTFHTSNSLIFTINLSGGYHCDLHLQIRKLRNGEGVTKLRSSRVEPRQSGSRVLTSTLQGMRGPRPVCSTWHRGAPSEGPFCPGQPFSLEESRMQRVLGKAPTPTASQALAGSGGAPCSPGAQGSQPDGGLEDSEGHLVQGRWGLLSGGELTGGRRQADGMCLRKEERTPGKRGLNKS